MIRATKSTTTKREQYTAAWNTIKEHGKLELTVHVRHADAVMWGILKAKARENTANRSMGLHTYSKLELDRTEVSAELVRMSFALSHDDRLL